MPLPLRMSYNEEITTLSLTRPCERSEAIQNCFQVDRHANTRDDQLLFNRMRTPFHSGEFAQTICGHHFTAENLLKPSADTISQLRICSNRLRTPFHSWEFAQTVCGYHFTAENLLKLSADTVSQWGIPLN